MDDHVAIPDERFPGLLDAILESVPSYPSPHARSGPRSSRTRGSTISPRSMTAPSDSPMPDRARVARREQSRGSADLR